MAMGSDMNGAIVWRQGMNGKVDHSEREIDLIFLFQTFMKLLLQHWWIPVTLALVCGGFTYGYTRKHYTPMYRAEVSTTVMVAASENSDNYGFYYDSNAANQLANTFPYILTSPILMDALKEGLGVEYVNGTLGVSVVEGSNLLTLSVTSTDPTDARDILEAVLQVYPGVAQVVIGNIEFHLIDTPTIPSEPYNFPNYVRSMGKGCIIGAGIGLVLLGVAALWNRKIYRPEQLKPISSMVCLGKISAFARKKHRYPTVQEKNIHGSFGDEVNSISLAVQRELDEMQGNVLMVTSTIAGEGKSMVAENLAYALAEQGKRVILVDGDLRKQDMWQKVGAQGKGGLREMTLEGKKYQEVMECCTPSGIHFVGGKNPVPSVPLVLNSQHMKEMWSILRKMADYVVLDTPPTLLFEDATLLSRYADGVLYVVRHDWIQRHQVVDALAHLGETHAKVIGFVYNGEPHTHAKYGYGYSYRYGGYGYGYGRKRRKQEG